MGRVAAAAGAGALVFGGLAASSGGVASTGAGSHAHLASPAVGVVHPELPAYRAGATDAPARDGFSTFAAEPFLWQEATAHPIERFESNGLAAHGRLWVIGGFGRWTTQASPRSDVYDLATDSWTRIADMPINVTHSPAVLVGEDIWLLGGFIGNHPGPSTSEVWRYDTSTNTWSPGPSLPEPRGAGGAALLGSKLHYFGGANRETGSTGYPNEPHHWVLDLADQGAGWQRRADLPAKRNHLAGAGLGGFVYAIGGQIGNEDTGNQSRVDRYDPVTDSWEDVAALPAARGHITASTFVLGGRLVVAGGTNNGNVPSRDMTSYDPATDSWQVLPQLPSGRKTPVLGEIGGRLVSATGYNGTGTDTVWVSNTLPFEVPPTDPGSDPDPDPAPGPGPGPGPPPGPDPDPGGAQPPPPPPVTPTPGGSEGTQGVPRPSRPAPGGKGGKVAFTVAQLRINQRIAQAALRKVLALEEIVLGRPAPAKRPAGGGGRLRLTAAHLRINQRTSQAALRKAMALEALLDGRPAPRASAGGAGKVTLSARQLQINQRIAQAALRRVNVLAARVARGGYRATELVRHAPSASGGCDCPICCGIASGSLTAAAERLVAARSAAGRIQPA
jgi:hypothetical protein